MENTEFFNHEEESYRRGAAHGFEVCSSLKEDEIDVMRKKIAAWRYDQTNKKGLPGTPWENKQIYN